MSFSTASAFAVPPAASTSSSPISTSPPLENQDPPPPKMKVRPCQTCKLRRVACKRTKNPDPAGECDWCIDRGMQCVRYEGAFTRKGKRIEMAKVAFGTRDPNEREQTAPPITAVERRLASMEIDSSLASHLIQRYIEEGYTRHDSPHFILPCLPWTEFQERFEAAGRNPEQMSAEDSVLCYIVFANAARVSQHPLIAGSAPDSFLSQARNSNPTRKNAYQVLIDKAMSMCDEKGLWRKETKEAPAILLLMKSLVADGDLGRKEAKRYGMMALQQLRELYEANPNRRTEVGGFDGPAWCYIILESLSSAETGTPLAVSEVDLQWFLGQFPFKLMPIPPDAVFGACLGHTAFDDRGFCVHQVFWEPWLRALRYIVMLARSVTEWKVWGNMGTVAQIWEKVDEAIDWAKDAIVVRPVMEQELQIFCEIYANTIWAVCVNLDSIILEHLTAYVSNWPHVRMGLTSNSQEDLTSLVTLLSIAQSRVREGFTQFIDNTRNDHGVDVLTLLAGTMFSVKRLDALTRSYISHLSTSGRTDEQKVLGLGFLHKTLTNTSAVWGGLEYALDEVNRNLEALRATTISWALQPLFDRSHLELTPEAKNKKRLLLSWRMASGKKLHMG